MLLAKINKGQSSASYHSKKNKVDNSRVTRQHIPPKNIGVHATQFGKF